MFRGFVAMFSTLEGGALFDERRAVLKLSIDSYVSNEGESKQNLTRKQDT